MVSNKQAKAFALAGREAITAEPPTGGKGGIMVKHFKFLGVVGFVRGRQVCWAGLYYSLDALPAPMFEAIFSV